MRPRLRATAGALGTYAAALTLTLATLTFGLRLEARGHLDLTVPLQYMGDVLQVLPMVQAQHEHGSYWYADRMGAPGRQELYDFPIIDALHFAAVRLLDRATGHPVVAFNLYHLLTYPLTTLTALFACRRLGLSAPGAVCVAVIYTFLPYHQMRGLAHYLLAAYYVVPLTLVLIVSVAWGRCRMTPARAAGAVAVALLTGCAGAYYAFFACGFLAVAGVYGALLRRRMRPLVVAAVAIALIVAVGTALQVPTFAHQREFGRNTEPTQRQPEDTEVYGLKLTHLFLPVEGHRLPALARLRSAYDSLDRPLQNDNRTATLGAVGSVGFVLAVLAVFRPRGKRAVRALGVLVLFAVLLATVGGLGAVFSQLVSPQVRAYNRVSVYVAFLALFTVMLSLDRLTRRRRTLRWAVAATLLAVGVLDLTDAGWFRWAKVLQRDAVTAKYRQDARFFAEVEAGFAGGAVFQLPYIAYPETYRCEQLEGYDHARGYLHTRATRWSFGAMRGREADQWQREVASSEVPAMLRRVVLRGFDALLIDRRGFAPGKAEELLAAVKTTLHSEGATCTHEDGQQLVFDLRPHRARLREDLGDSFDALTRAEEDGVRMLWLSGFVSFEPLGREATHRWCARSGEAWFVNPTAVTRRVTLTMILRTPSVHPTALRVEGEVWREELSIDVTSGAHAVTVQVPPGRHVVRFACAPPKDWMPHDSRKHVFFVAQFQMTEDP